MPFHNKNRREIIIFTNQNKLKQSSVRYIEFTIHDKIASTGLSKAFHLIYFSTPNIYLNAASDNPSSLNLSFSK